MEPMELMEPMVVNGTNGVNGTEIDPCVACLLDALVKVDSGAVLVNVTAEIEFSGDRVENITSTISNRR